MTPPPLEDPNAPEPQRQTRTAVLERFVGQVSAEEAATLRKLLGA